MIRRECPRILLVEKDGLEKSFVTGILENEGCEVLAVEDRLEGCRLLPTEELDLILCAWVSEEGLGVVGDFHQLRRAEIPLVLLTNEDGRPLVADALNAGVSDVLVRPMSPKELSARVWSQIGLRQAVLRLERREKELEELSARLQQEKNDRDKLLGIMAHDLKSPILGISGFLTEVTAHYSDYDRSQIEHFLRELRDSSEKVRDLLMNLLDWAKAQMSGEDLKPIEINLLFLVDQVAGVLKEVFGAKALRFHTRLEILCVQYDFHILAAVLRNLLTNAAKFTPRGGTIEVRSRLGRGGPILEVKDTGVGMDLQTVADLMSFSQRVTTKGTNGEIGTGLGLKLSRDLVARAGGTLSLRSEKGLGTLVTIQLPPEATCPTDIPVP